MLFSSGFGTVQRGVKYKMNILQFDWEYPKKLDPVFSFSGRYIVLKGGRSSGKSHFIARKLLEDRLHLKRDLLCVREYQTNLKDSNYKLIKNIIIKYGLPFKIYADKFVSETTGSEIVFVGMNNLTADNIKSYEGFTDAWIEEGQNFSKASFELLDPTIRDSDSKIYVSMNPKFVEDEVLTHIETTFPDDSLIIHINYLDNPFCPKNMIKQANGYRDNKPEEYHHIWMGEPLKTLTNSVIKYFTDENIKPISYQPDMDLHIACDFNVDPMCWLLLHKTEDKLFYFDEIVLENTTTRECAEEFCNRYPSHTGKIIINGDASGTSRSTQSELHNYMLIRKTLERNGYDKVEFNLRSWNPRIKNRVLAFNNKVLTNKGERCILVDPKCEKLLYNVKYLKYKEGTSTIDTPTSSMIAKDRALKFLSHPFDSASYPAEYYFPVIIEYPDEPKKEYVNNQDKF